MSSHGRRDKEFSEASFRRTHIPFIWKGSAFPEAPPSNTIMLGLGFSVNLEEMAERMIQTSQEGDRRTAAESIPPPQPYSHSIQLGGIHSFTEYVLIKPLICASATVPRLDTQK